MKLLLNNHHQLIAQTHQDEDLLVLPTNQMYWICYVARNYGNYS